MTIPNRVRLNPNESTCHVIETIGSVCAPSADLHETQRTTDRHAHARVGDDLVPTTPGHPHQLDTGTRYRTILADPPWEIQQQGTKGANRHYSLMSLERIKAMPVADLAAPHAHCWLWVTNATLRIGYDVLDAWGFIPRSPLTWIKPRIGLGNYLRNATEHLILGTRGNAPVRFRSQPTWMFAPLQDHSHKPEEQYAIIERISSGPYLELFARRRQPGWDAWGNQIDSDISIPGFPVPSDQAHSGEGLRHE